MPDEMLEAISSNREYAIEAMRIAVRQTKSGILARYYAAFGLDEFGEPDCLPPGTAMSQEIPKDGTPILAYVITRRLKGWMVTAYNGHYWQTIPGKYGVDRIVRWVSLPPPAPDEEPIVGDLFAAEQEGVKK